MSLISDLLHAVHAAAESGFGGANEPDLPARTGLVHRPEGPTWEAVDCDILATNLRRVYPSAQGGGLPDGARHIGSIRFIAEVGVTILRCGSPNVDNQGNPPSADALETYAEQTADDATALINGLEAGWRNKDFGACAAVTFGELTPLGPDGGMAGWRIVLTVEL